MSHVRKREIPFQLLFDTTVEYEILPAEDGLPEQLEITAIHIHTFHKTKRKVNVLHALSESEIINLEDELMEEIHEQRS